MDISAIFNPTHNEARAQEGNCYCQTCSVAYHRAQKEAIKGFRNAARYSYVTENGVRHAYSTLEAAQQAQEQHGVSLPIWDAVEQKEVGKTS